MNQEALIGRDSVFNRIIQPLLIPKEAKKTGNETNTEAFNQVVEPNEEIVGLNLTFRHYEEKANKGNEIKEDVFYYTEKQRKGLFHYWDNTAKSIY